MQDLIGEQESIIRLVAFAGLFALFALSEVAKPRRKLTVSKANRWFTNLAIVVLDSLIV